MGIPGFPRRAKPPKAQSARAQLLRILAARAAQRRMCVTGVYPGVTCLGYAAMSPSIVSVRSLGDALGWVKSMPKNTILFCSRSQAEDAEMRTPVRFRSRPVRVVLRMCRDRGIRAIADDVPPSAPGDFRRVNQVAATCLGHLARISWTARRGSCPDPRFSLKFDPAIGPGIEDALNDIKFFLRFQ
jgi:hypothetical protein